uniref:Putative secreted protein n=1 Tax=Anopheles darlingi TaxID=43151 RepID=A0A2M4D335_ANODA
MIVIARLSTLIRCLAAADRRLTRGQQLLVERDRLFACRLFLFSPEREAARFLHDRRCVDEQIGRRTLVRPEHVQFPEALGFDHLFLPRYRHRAGVELGVEVLIRRVQIDTLYRGELLDI